MPRGFRGRHGWASSASRCRRWSTKLGETRERAAEKVRDEVEAAAKKAGDEIETATEDKPDEPR